MRTSKSFVPDIIITGGQSGADFGGLLGARACQIETGGIAPRGWKTETGAKPELGSVFGLIESDSDKYDVRTAENIRIAQAVIVVAYNFESAGTKLTMDLSFQCGIPVFPVPYSPMVTKYGNLNDRPYLLDDIRSWLDFHSQSVLMIAGNRESKAVGIQNFTRDLVIKLFS